MQNGRIRNNQITASSEVNRYHAAWVGRLGRVKTGRYIGAWCPKHRNHNQWFKVDFRRLMKITKIATQGRQDAGHWVTSYYLSSSVDNVHWAIYRFRSVNKVASHTMVNGRNGYDTWQSSLYAFAWAILVVGSAQNLEKYKRWLCVLIKLTNRSIAIM